MKKSLSDPNRDEHGRFRKGTTGNPRGRPVKGSRGQGQTEPVIGSAFDDVLAKDVSIVRNGVAQKLSVEEAVLWRLITQAFQGDAKSIRKLLPLILDRERAIHALQIKPERPSKDQFRCPSKAKGVEEVMVLLDMLEVEGWDSAAEQPRYLFKPWIVQTAISRPGKPSFTLDDLKKLSAWMVGFKDLIWPRRYTNSKVEHALKHIDPKDTERWASGYR